MTGMGHRRGARRSSLPPIPSQLGLPTIDIRVLTEPTLLFGDFQRCSDPRLGLGLHGPFDVHEAARTSAVRLGVIGTGDTIELLQQWVERSRTRIAPIRRVKLRGAIKPVPMDPLVYPFFPGVEDALGMNVVFDSALVQTISDRDISELRAIEYFEPRVTRLVEMVIERLRVLDEKPTRPHVVIVALNDEVRGLCTQITKHTSRAKRPRSLADAALRDVSRDEDAGQQVLFSAGDMAGLSEEAIAQAAAEADEHGVFHHGLKARAMEVGIPTQLVWETSLAGVGVQDDATRAWNFWTAMYYKAGNVPWRAAGVARGTCFVGVSFYVDRTDGSYRSAMAQAFSDHGEGIVMRGRPFRWTQLRSPHLTGELAEDLMNNVLREYSKHVDHAPARVVVHKWSQFWDDERAGFDRALSNIKIVDYVAFGSRDIRLFRVGKHPPLRGTLVTLDRGNALLYTRGYVPYFGAHVGARVPRPIEIVQHLGPTSLTQIAQEILLLTKLDWNTSDFGGREPITTAFSKDVGAILAELPREAAQPKTLYRFYM